LSAEEKKPQPILIPSDEEMKRLKLKTVDLPGLVEYAHSVGGFSIVPTEQGVIKGKAMSAMKEQTGERLNMILEQMRVLARQAQDIRDRVEVSEEIYGAQMSFEPVMGKSYYLYRRTDESRVLSLVAPHEWGKTKKLGHCLAKAELLSDHTWRVLERYPEEEV
jgi:hypothetical protein